MLAIPVNQDNSPEAVMQILFQLKVKDVMTRPVLAASPSDTMQHIQKTMKKKRITGIPIVGEDRELVGIVDGRHNKSA